ncbi:LAME_0C00210g1_1 [Lachancea meyersii CBS 8951]|uniref:LAME_0C00210g1_1 n=1 Tax=Lachancea meyersii CBS 8951 TaxID=1266667 RepID=A0A1G4IYP9_9SACH|nr:LAME_0C00210g1_1 [Lachancea meyersii CBS 8951]
MDKQPKEPVKTSIADTIDNEAGSLSELNCVFSTQQHGEKIVVTTIMSPNGKETEITADFDDAMKLGVQAMDIEPTPEESRRLVRKIDLCMFPLMSLVYAIQFMDKTTIGTAAIMGLITDLKMTGDDYSWAGSAFYFGYLGGLFVLPPLLQKTQYFMKFLCSIIMLWGLILALHSAPSVNYASFIVLRCLLGFFESSVTPAFTIITSQYWKKEEQFLRICIWFGFNGLGAMWGSSMAYGLYIRAGTYSISAWKIVFLSTGCITIFAGVLMMLHLPDSPLKAWFLTKHEKLVLTQRIRGNQQGFGNHHIKKHQIREALIDPRTWLYFLYCIAANIPNGALTNFQSILFKSDFGYTTKKTLLVSTGIAAVEWGGLPLLGFASYYCSKKQVKYLESRLIWSIISLLITFMGMCMLAFANDSKNARLAGLALNYISPLAFICVLANISANTLGYTKKWTVSSTTLIGYAAANLAGPHTFISSQAPHYTGAKVALVVCYGACIVIIAALYVLNANENKRRDKLALENPPQSDMKNIEFADLTDFENPYFRYTL